MISPWILTRPGGCKVGGWGAEEATGDLGRQRRVREGESPKQRAQQSTKARGGEVSACLHTYMVMEGLGRWPALWHMPAHAL